MSKIKVSRKSFKGWDNCLEISNGMVEAIVTTDIGPRIISFGFKSKSAGGGNMFCEKEDQAGLTGGSEWMIYGGHRLWHSPECKPRTYEPDNGPVESKVHGGKIMLRQPVEPWTKIRKEMEITMPEGAAGLKILHRLTNEGAWDVKLAVWSLTVMDAGGREIVPQVTRDTGLLPNRMVSLWPYTDMKDSRLYWGSKYIMITQDSEAKGPLKIGLPVEDGWAAYINRSQMFVKKFKHVQGAEYPDNGSSYETYTNNFMVEMESLSPLVTLAPGASVEHVEDWMLFKNVSMPENEDDIDRQIVPLILG